MKPQDKTALSLALAIVGGMVADMRYDASEWVENSSQTNPRSAAYTVKAYRKVLSNRDLVDYADPFDAIKSDEIVFFVF